MLIILIIKTRVFKYWKSTERLSCSKGTIFTSTFLSFLYIWAWTQKLCCCGNNSSHSLISSLDRWRAGSQVHDDMGHPFHLIRYSISYEKINKKWNGRLKTSLGTAAFKEAVSTYFAAFPLRKQSFSQKHFYLSSALQTTCRVVSFFLFRNCLILLF